MKPDYKSDRSEAAIIWMCYLGLLFALLILAYVAWREDGFAGGMLFGASLTTASWLTVKVAHAMDRDRRGAWERRL